VLRWLDLVIDNQPAPTRRRSYNAASSLKSVTA